MILILILATMTRAARALRVVKAAETTTTVKMMMTTKTKKMSRRLLRRNPLLQRKRAVLVTPNARRRSLRRRSLRKRPRKRLRRKRRRRFLVFPSSQPLLQAPNSVTLPSKLGKLSLSTSLAKNVTPLSRVQSHLALEKRPPPPPPLLQAPLPVMKLRQLLILKLLLIRLLPKLRMLVKSINTTPAKLLLKRLRLMPNPKRQIQPRNLQKLLPRPLHMLPLLRQMLK